jgi:catechol 2,3-dioxygenase-like lactoylglutathione lyase family enzyme
VQLQNVGAITLFVEDLAAASAFYREAFGLPVHFADDASTVFDLGNTVINLLKVEEAVELVGEARVGKPDAGTRAQYTIQVDDADATCAELTGRGVALLNGPIDRPWGQRTAAFADPAGHIWEIAQTIAQG